MSVNPNRYNPITVTNNRYSPVSTDSSVTKNITPEYVNPATLDQATQPKLSQAAPRGRVSTFLNNVSNFIEPVTSALEGTPFGRTPIKEQATKDSLINSSNALFAKKKSGQPLTNEESAIMNEGMNLQTSQIANNALGFIGSMGVTNPIKQVINTKTPNAAAKMLRALGFTEDVVSTYSPRIVAANDSVKAAQVLDELTAIKNTKPVPKLSAPAIDSPTQKTNQAAPEIINPELPGNNVTPKIKEPASYTPSELPSSPIDYATDVYKTAQSNMPELEIQSLEKVIANDKRTPLNERVRIIDYLRTPVKVFERMGIRPQYEELLKGYQNYVAELPKNIDKITEWSKQVPAESNERIFKYLDGEKIDLTPAESKVTGEIKTWLGEWADRLGMKPDSRISDYITHIFPFGKGGEIPEEIASLINKKIPGSVYNPFLLQRQGVEGYLKDTWKALDAYVKRATRKVHMDPALASLKEATDKMTEVSQLNYLNRYVGAINLRPTELDTLIDNTIKDKFGYLFGARPTSLITRNIRMMIARAKLGGSVTSFAKNLTQGVNTFSELGSSYTAKGYIDLVRFGGKELQENGVLIAPFVEDRTYSAVKKWAEKFDNALFINMSASELVNRGAAYYGAKAKFLSGKTTPKEFKQAFGKSMPNGYKPTLNDAIAYGKFISGKTQFLFGPLDTPVALNSDIAKTTGQFQTFGLKQTEFILNMVGAKEYWKLIRYILSSMLLFTYVGSQFGMSWDDSWKTFKFGAPPAYTFAKDVFGAIMGTKDQYGNIPSTSSRLKTVRDSLFTNIVPGGAQIKRSVEGFKAVNQGASRGNPSKANPRGIFQYKIDKTPMNYVRATLFGKQNLDQAKDYYNKKTPVAPSSSSRYNPI